MLDATFEKVREGGRVIAMAVLIAVAVKSTGEREVVGVDVGPAEDHQFWLAFCRQLVDRGLAGVRLVISDALPGPQAGGGPGLHRRHLAALPRLLHEERPLDGAQGGTPDGGSDD